LLLGSRIVASDLLALCAALLRLALWVRSTLRFMHQGVPA
jgi:hypothetical protein